MQKKIDRFENMEIYSEVEVDCFQNLLISCLRYLGVNINLLKLVWPWEFIAYYQEKDTDQLEEIEHFDAVDLNRVKKYFNVEYVRKAFDKEDRIEILINVLKNGKEVFVCLDEFYIPYHFSYIYQKEHGAHTLLLTGIDKESNQVSCMSSIPFFRGEIDYNAFYEALYSDEVNAWYCYFDYSALIKRQECNYEKFISQMLDRSDMNKDTLRTEDLLKYLKTIDEYDRRKKLELYCNGTWGWKIANKGELLISFFRDTSIYCGNERMVEEIIGFIEEINILWNKSFKLTFKSVYSKNHADFITAKDLLEQVCEKEKHLYKVLKEYMEVIKGGRK